MRQILTTLGCIATLATTPALAQEFETDQERQSYAVGVQMGNAVKAGQDLLDLEVMINGLMDVLSGKDIPMDQQEITAAFRQWQTATREKQSEAMTAEGKEFLEANAKRDEVTVLPSGLQYEVLREGDGDSPDETDTVRAHYRGTLIDGTEFDSSYGRNQPFEAKVTGVIPGWTEALQLMKEGAKWRIYVPHNLGYGPRGAGNTIPPYATLIFEMELLEVMDDQ